DSFTYKASHVGGDSNAATVTIHVISVNDAPTGTDNTVTTLEDTAYAFTTSDFGFSDSNDSPANAFLAVEITTLPATGSLSDNGAALVAGEFVTAADIAAGKLNYTPPTNAFGERLAGFTFQVQDNGGFANGGADLDPTARTMFINAISVKDR